MSEAAETKTKSYEELRTQYNQLAFQVGLLQYEVTQKNKDIDAFMTAMRDIAIEASKVKPPEPTLESVKPATEEGN